MEDKSVNRRVLIVDDQQIIHDAFSTVFTAPSFEATSLDDLEASLFGESTTTLPVSAAFELDHAYQGEEGFHKVVESRQRGAPYALAFVDMRMPPGWDGLETIARLLESDDEIQLVMCTAYSDYTWSQVLARIGYTDRLLLLKKPFATEEAYQLAIALTEKYRLSRDYHRQLRD